MAGICPFAWPVLFVCLRLFVRFFDTARARLRGILLGVRRAAWHAEVCKAAGFVRRGARLRDSGARRHWGGLRVRERASRRLHIAAALAACGLRC